jgi:simple sugar transport system permease protein
VNNSLFITLLVSGIVYGTPLLIAALGELLTERSGVLNLAVEGMMLVGAASGFWVSQLMHGPGWLALVVAALGAMVAGALMALIHGVMTITLGANQVVSGIALGLFGGVIGLSTYLAFVGGLPGELGTHYFRKVDVFGLGDAAVVGPLLFHHDALVYLSWVLVIVVSVYLNHTRLGLNLRSVGESPQTADAMGINVTAYRYAHTVVGGALAGLAGAYYSLAITRTWSNGVTAGAGWIAIGLVIFAFWRPGLVLVGAYLFGVLTSLGFALQARGVQLPPEFFSMLPYLMTVVVLVLVSAVWSKRRVGAPAALGVAFKRDDH